MNQEKRLESWKEIEAYLKRDFRTLRRWEKEEGLPVHRHSHKSRSSVYAYPSEIEAWRVSRKAVAEPAPAPARPLWRVPAFVLTVAACLVMVGNGIRPQVASAQQGRTLAKRLLCAECGDREADFSTDGRLMVFTDWNSGDLATRDMSTGKVKRLMLKTGTGKDSDAYAEQPVLSPDLRQIVYLWETEDKEQHAQLRVMPNEPGGKPRILVDNPEYTYYKPAGWSPDGKSVLVTVVKPDKTWQLVRVSVSDGAVKPVKSLDWRFSGILIRPHFSPDGQYILYSALAVNPSKLPPAATDPKDQHIYVLASDGSTETEIVKTAGLNQNPVWTPDGKHILFLGDRSGKFDLWSIAMQSGKPVGSASLVTGGMENVAAIGMRGGSYYYTYTQQQGASDVNIVEMAAGGSAQGRAHATESLDGIHPTWSPDGKSIAFKRLHPRGTGYDLVVHSLETGDERAYVQDATGAGAVTWYHDGKSVMTGVRRSNGSGALHRIDLKSGEIEELPSNPVPNALSPDDKTLYISRRDPKDPDNIPDHIAALDLSTRQETQILTLPGPGATLLLLSPDAHTLVVRWPEQKTGITHFARLNIDGTGYREIYAEGQKDQAGAMALTNDGRWLLFEARHDDKWRLMRLPIEGGTPESTGVELDGSVFNQRTIDLSPDGSLIAYTTVKPVSELWALDNVLSVLK